MLLEEMTEVQEPSVIYEDNPDAISLANNSQVGICTRKIDICHHFLNDMVEYKDIDIQYIRSEDNPAEKITKNTSEADFVKAHEEDYIGINLGACGYWKGEYQ